MPDPHGSTRCRGPRPHAIVELPGGLSMRAASVAEARVLHHEIFEARAYDRHGVVVRDGDCVFDVGANVGFFCVYLARRHAGLRLYAFEPVPEVFRLLSLNAEQHLGEGARLFPYGISAAAESAVFRYDPRHTIAASCRGDDVGRSGRRNVSALEWARAVIADEALAGALHPAAAALARGALATRGVGGAVVALMRAAAAAAGVGRRLREREVIARVRPLSDVIREEGVGRIDLLKIDVEGAEWEALRGVEREHWPLVRQVAVEVHDVDGRVDRVRSLLEAEGFRVVVDRGDWAFHDLLGIRTVFATRAG